MSLRQCVASTVIILALAGCTDGTARFKAHLEQAENSYSAGNFEKARVELKNALQIEPESIAANYKLGRTLQELQRWTAAGGVFIRVLGIAPDHIPTRLALARIYLGSSSPEKASEHIDAALNADPPSADALALRASLRIVGNDLAGAIADAQGALNGAPERADIAMLLTTALARNKQWDEAQAVLDRELKAHPLDEKLWELKAKLDYRQGDKNAAAQSLSSVLEISPGRLDIQNVLATIYSELGKDARADEVFEQSIAHSPDALRAKLAMVRHLVRTRGADAGIERIKGFLAADPGALILHFSYADILEYKSDFSAAEAIYRAIIQEHMTTPAGLRARQLLALSKARRRDTVAALTLAHEILDVNPLDRKALLLRGALSLVQNDPGTAILSLRTVLRDHPDDISGRKLLARAHVLNNEWDQARDVLQRATESNPDDLDSHLLLVQIFDQINDPSLRILRDNTLRSARSLLDAALGTEPNDVDSLIARGKVRLLSGRYKEAHRDLLSATRKAPNNPDALRLLAHAEILSNRTNDGSARFQQALKSDKSHVASRIDYARQLAGNGELDKALEQLNQGLVYSPRNFYLLRLKARVHQDLKQWPQLENTAFELQKIANRDPLGFHLYGLALQATRRLDQSRDAFQEAVNRSPNAVQSLTALARTYFAQGDLETALRQLDSALKATPNDLAALNLRGEVLLALKRFDEAEASFEKALSIRPEWTVPYQNLGEARLAQGDAAGAVAAFSNVGKDSPNSMLAAYKLALAYEQLNKDDLAIAQYEAILARDSAQQVAGNNLAMLLVKPDNKTPTRIARAEEITRSFETSSQSQFRDTRAWVLRAAENVEAAVELLNELVSQEKDTPIYRYHLALAKLDMNDKAAAIENLRAALESKIAFTDRTHAREVFDRLTKSP
jgi:tetratricopeptide (TPR) repeat protein